MGCDPVTLDRLCCRADQFELKLGLMDSDVLHDQRNPILFNYKDFSKTLAR
jgi:hypothetical protein